MSDFRHRQIGELSGGQRKRVFLARALAQEGQVILLDEPFTGVDVQTEDQIIDLLREMRDEGRVMLVSTHNLGSVPWSKKRSLPTAQPRRHSHTTTSSSPLAACCATLFLVARICTTMTTRAPSA